MWLAPGMLCPEGAVGLSPGFQSWEPTPKRRALKGRQIERTNHTNAGCLCNMSIARSSRPFRASRFIDWLPGLKPGFNPGLSPQAPSGRAFGPSDRR
jgi:hypothetical protein